MAHSMEQIPVGEAHRNPQFTTITLLMGALVKALELGATEQAKTKRDFLTGLHNRAALEDAYAGLKQADTGRRTTDTEPIKRAHHLVFIDIDHFKAINDEQGHLAGDIALKTMGDLLQARVRERDMPSRLGGDEFVVLLPRTSRQQAMRIAAGLGRLSKLEADLSLSIGVTKLNLETSLDENLGDADIAMYTAKRQGPGRLEYYQESLRQA